MATKFFLLLGVVAREIFAASFADFQIEFSGEIDQPILLILRFDAVVT
ncbi:hypothetical protein LAY57_05325 [Argonema antarcticum A004/B2]|nr:hypothetical protein [Argonema antarcticum A004/B2]